MTSTESLHVFLDWDGTLTDSINMFVNTLEQSVEKLDPLRTSPATFDRKHVISLLKLSNFQVALEKMYGEEKITNVSDRLTQRFCGEDCLFPGVRESLQRLKNEGYQLHLISHGNVEHTARRIMAQHILGLFSTFHLCIGVPKEGIIRAICPKMHYSQAGLEQSCTMIGDAVSDMISAKAAGIQAVGVSTGLFSSDELSKHGPVFTSFVNAVDYIFQMRASRAYSLPIEVEPLKAGGSEMTLFAKTSGDVERPAAPISSAKAGSIESAWREKFDRQCKEARHIASYPDAYERFSGPDYISPIHTRSTEPATMDDMLFGKQDENEDANKSSDTDDKSVDMDAEADAELFGLSDLSVSIDSQKKAMHKQKIKDLFASIPAETLAHEHTLPHVSPLPFQSAHATPVLDRSDEQLDPSAIGIRILAEVGEIKDQLRRLTRNDRNLETILEGIDRKLDDRSSPATIGEHRGEKDWLRDITAGANWPMSSTDVFDKSLSDSANFDGSYLGPERPSKSRFDGKGHTG